MASTAAIPLTKFQKSLCLCGCLAFFAVAYLTHGLFQHSQVDSILEKSLHETSARSPGWQLAELEAARAKIPDNENAAYSVHRAANYLPPDYHDKLRYRLVYNHSGVPWRLGPYERDRIVADLNLHIEALFEAFSLAEQPRGRYPLRSIDRPWEMQLLHAVEVEQVVLLLTLDAIAETDSGDLVEAARACRAALGGARSLGDEPDVNSQLIRKTHAGVAARGVRYLLNHSVSDPDTLAELQRLLEAEADHPGFAISLRGWRAIVNLVLANVESGNVQWSQVIKEPAHSGLFSWQFTVNLDEVRRQHADLLPLFGRFVEVADMPAPERARKFQEIESEAESAVPLLKVLVQELPLLERQFATRDAILRCTVAALAVERYRIANNGRWPASWLDLTPTYLRETPLDPANGEALRYERLEDGIAISSACEDDISPAPYVAMRLWDVSERGKIKPSVPQALQEPDRRKTPH